MEAVYSPKYNQKQDLFKNKAFVNILFFADRVFVIVPSFFYILVDLKINDRRVTVNYK